MTGTAVRNWSTLLCFEMLYRGIGFTVLFPFVRYLLSFLPGLTGAPYIGQDNVLLMFRSPLAVLLLIGIFLLTGAYIYFEIVSLLIYSELGWRRERATVWGLWKEAARKTAGLLRPRRLPVFLLLPVMMLSVFSIASGYLRAVHIPEFILDFLREDALYLLLAVGTVVLFHVVWFFYLFGLPALLFTDTSFGGSVRESLRLLRNRKWRTAGVLALYTLLTAAAFLLITAVGVLLLGGGIRLLYSPDAGRARFMMCFITLEGVWQIVAGALTSVLLCAIAVVLYHRYRGDVRPPALETPRTKWRRFRRAAAILCTLAVLCAFGTSELGGRVWYPAERLTKIVAHRAGGGRAPENTAAALRRAIHDGAHMAEIDVRQLGDGTLAVLHDANFKRTTGVDLNVWEADSAALSRLDAGSSFSGRYAGEPVPTLEELLRIAKGKIRLMIEIKATGHERDLVECTLALIREYGMRDQCMIASMDMDLLKRVKQLDPHIKTVYITVLLLARDLDLKHLDAYSVETTALSAGLVAQAHLQGKQVFAWTANTKDTMLKILRCEADGMVTDQPPLAEECIRDAGENMLLRTLTDWFFPRMP